MNLWMMDQQSLAHLLKVQESVLAGTATLEQTMTRPITRMIDDVAVMGIHGPIFARANLFTEWMNLYSTEQYMTEFETLLKGDKKIMLDVDSGGGQVALAFEFAEMIQAAGDRVTSYVGGTAASAGMLFHSSAMGGSYAHDVAMLGSLGVVIQTEEREGVEYILSENAEDKRGKGGLQKLVNSIENKFVSYVAKGSGMTDKEVLANSEKGGMFLGADAVEKGFVDKTTNFKGALASTIGGQSATTKGENDMPDISQEDHDAAVLAASDKARMEGRAEGQARAKRIYGHANAENKEAADMVMNSTMSDDDAVAFMDQVKVDKPEGETEPAPAPAPVAPAAKTAEEIEAEITQRSEKLALEALKKVGINSDVPVGASNDGEGEPLAYEKMTQEQKDAADYQRGFGKGE